MHRLPDATRLSCIVRRGNASLAVLYLRTSTTRSASLSRKRRGDGRFTPARAELWERHFRGKFERDRLLPALFAYSGLRRSELLGLDWDDVDLSRRDWACARRRAAGSGPSRSTRRSRADRRLLRDPRAARRAGALRRRPGRAAQGHPARPTLPSLRRGERRRQAQARERTRSGTSSPPSSSTPARTSARSRSYSVTSTSTRPSATRE